MRLQHVCGDLDLYINTTISDFEGYTLTIGEGIANDPVTLPRHLVLHPYMLCGGVESV